MRNHAMDGYPIATSIPGVEKHLAEMK